MYVLFLLRPLNILTEEILTSAGSRSYQVPREGLFTIVKHAHVKSDDTTITGGGRDLDILQTKGGVRPLLRQRAAAAESVSQSLTNQAKLWLKFR